MMLLLCFCSNNKYPEYNFMPSEYTYEDNNIFFIEVKIGVNKLKYDEYFNEKYEHPTNGISLNYQIRVVPKNREDVFLNLKAEAEIDESINKKLLIPTRKCFASYVLEEDDGVTIGKNQPTFGLDIGGTTWLNKNLIQIHNLESLLRKDINITIQWKDGLEEIIFPKDKIVFDIYE